MSRLLPADCLDEIFEYLEGDIFNLCSCLLVNRLWCEIAVRILWKNIWNFQYLESRSHRAHVPLAIISTLVACLPNESKDLLSKNGIFIAPPTWKPLLFNYASFFKVLLIHKIDQMIKHVLEKQQSITSQSLSINYDKYLVSNELLKMFMNQIPSLKSLNYYSYEVENTLFTYLPEAKNCLANLTELNCSSDIDSEFFYQISYICHNIQSLTIYFGDVISNGISDLISLQNNLKSVTLQDYYCEKGKTSSIISSLIKSSSTLTKLSILDSYISSLSFVAMLTNLQELIISFDSISDEFNHLQNVSFPQLKVLNFLMDSPNAKVFIKFLEINGKNLNELYIGDNDVNLAIAKFCPNLRILCAMLMDNEELKAILNSCQCLESIEVDYTGKGLFDVIAEYSPKNFHKLRIYYIERQAMNPEILESFFTKWKNRIPQKQLTLTAANCGLVNEECMKIIEKYKKLGIIKKVKI